jgi:methionyl-tRNA formyltransferase
LQYLRNLGVRPRALLLSDATRATHSDELRALCDYLDDSAILTGKQFRELSAQSFLANLQPDYIVCIHFPYIVPKSVLDIPRYGVLNLHPAYLPYNRGWHTPSWALLEQTPVGATLHFMDEGIDTGDIVHQKQLAPSADDTANSLYAKLKMLEFEVFNEAWPMLAKGNHTRIAQQKDTGSTHKRSDLFSPEIQEINLDKPQLPRDLIRQLRALTTNDLSEAAYYRDNGKTFRVQVTIVEE